MTDRQETALLENTANLQKELSKLMEERLSLVPEPLAKESLILAALEKIPFFSGLVQSTRGAESAISGLVHFHGVISPTLKSVNNGFQYASIATQAMEFFRIPAIYLAAFILGEKPPITLSKNARFLYSATLLSLTIASLAFPAAAPFIALAGGTLGLGVSIVTLGKLFYDRHHYKQKIVKFSADLDKKNIALNEVISETKQLELAITEAKIDNKDVESLKIKLSEIEDKFEDLLKEKQQLTNKQFKYKEKLKELDTGKVVDKSVGILLSSIGVVGLVVSLFFPPIGLGILAASAVLGGSYLIGREATPWIQKIFTSIRASFAKKPEGVLVDPPELEKSPLLKPVEDLSNVPQVSITPALSLPTVHSKITSEERLSFDKESVSDEAFKQVFAEKNGSLQQQIKDNSWIEHLNNKLSIIFLGKKSQPLPAILSFFKQLAIHLQATAPSASPKEINRLFEKLDDGDNLYPLLQKAINAVQAEKIAFPNQQQILSSPGLNSLLEEKQVNLQELNTPANQFSVQEKMDKSDSDQKEEEDGEKEGSIESPDYN